MAKGPKGGGRIGGDYLRRKKETLTARPSDSSKDYGTVPLPGEATLTLPAGVVKVFRWFDVDESAARGNSGVSGTIRDWDIILTITSPSGSAIPCSYLIGSGFEVSDRHRVISYVARFEVTEPGEHKIVSEGTDGSAHPFIFLGLGP